MDRSHQKPVVCIVGPTASGKSALAQLIALEIDGEIVSADSMQIYRGMDIGTGKVPESKRAVKHYGLDLADPGEPWSAALFQEYARQCFDEIEAKGKWPILCGGTGFYVRAAIDDYDFPKGEQVDNELRNSLNALAEAQGAHVLWEQLHDADPKSADIIPENDVKRVVRAFELLEEGLSYAEQKEKLAHIGQYKSSVFIGLAVEPDTLRQRIRDRVDEMVAEGLVEEVESLLARGFRQGVTAPQAIGYKEIVQALDEGRSLDEAFEEIKVATWRYAKRQRTWFRKDKRVHWIDATVLDMDSMLKESIEIIDAACRIDES